MIDEVILRAQCWKGIDTNNAHVEQMFPEIGVLSVLTEFVSNVGCLSVFRKVYGLAIVYMTCIKKEGRMGQRLKKFRRCCAQDCSKK